READALVLESPLSPTRMILPGYTGSAWVAELAQPRTYRDLYERVGGLAEGNAEVFLGLLINASLVAEVGKDGSLAEDNNPALLQWEFHDLLFHSRSRIGAHDYPLGGTFRFLG